ncbi:hypothetical protein BV20DRAFT_68356 [Pilatotrama ljubarskyi]|nr:hypothetical protein BV20DRAFT_68356 [Pilatotrama ljubarskyi]
MPPSRSRGQIENAAPSGGDPIPAYTLVVQRSKIINCEAASNSHSNVALSRARQRKKVPALPIDSRTKQQLHPRGPSRRRTRGHELLRLLILGHAMRHRRALQRPHNACTDTLRLYQRSATPSRAEEVSLTPCQARKRWRTSHSPIHLRQNPDNPSSCRHYVWHSLLHSTARAHLKGK